MPYKETNKETNFTSIEVETRSAIPTNNAAHHLSRKDQTLRAWACHENGPIKPVRINGRLAWSVAEIKKLLNGGS
jgi:hypothetical protein